MSFQPRESTNGILYAYGRSLYVTLTRYRSRRNQQRHQHGQPQDLGCDGISEPHGVVSARSRKTARELPGCPLDRQHAGDRLGIAGDVAGGLQRLPSAQSSPLPPPSQSAGGEKADPPKKDAEIEALRKELQEIKKQLAEQQAERARSQPQHTAPQR